MGLWYQCVVDRDAQDEVEAQELSARILTWLVDEDIVHGTLTPCCMGADDMGYAPGPNFMKAAGGAETSASNCNYADFSAMRTNGLQVLTHREMSFNMQGEFIAVRCPGCDTESEQGDAWSSAVQAWLDGQTGDLECEQCGSSAPVSEWEHVDPAGFGTLTFKFWDWPPLTDAFLAELAQRLGHRTIVITGKI